MKLRLYPSPILAQPTKPVTFHDRDVLAAREMLEYCRRCRGYALAAPQVGIGKSFFVIDPRHDPLGAGVPWLMVNPEITFSEGEYAYEETCLSLPVLWPKGHGEGQLATRPLVVRPYRIGVRYQDQNGDVHGFTGQGLVARVIQHELAHLRGETYLPLISAGDRPAVEQVLRAAGLPVPWTDAVVDESTPMPVANQTTESASFHKQRRKL